MQIHISASCGFEEYFITSKHQMFSYTVVYHFGIFGEIRYV